MAAIPRDLIESELFGHEKGAFTGANNRAAPAGFEQAEGGTLFLDEIGDMPMEAQTRLLRVLQQGEYTTVGGRTPIKTDVRIIAATNKDLRVADPAGPVPRGSVLPPQRRAAAAAAFARARRGRSGPDPALFRAGASAKACRRSRSTRLRSSDSSAHRWPGNVRELENLARRLAALYPQETITAAVIDAGAVAADGDDRRERGRARAITSAMRSSATSPRYFAEFEDGLPPAGLYHRILREIEFPLLTAALAATRGNQIRAADLLGVNRNTLRKKIRDLDIQVYRGSN